MSSDHPLLTMMKPTENAIEKKTGKNIKDTVAVLIYGPYFDPDDDSTDNFHVSIYDPESPDKRRESWPQNFEAMIEVLRRELI